MQKRHLLTGLALLALPVFSVAVSLAQDNGNPPGSLPAAPRVSQATTRPIISQAEAYALRDENAKLKQQIADLKAQLAGKVAKVQPKPLAQADRDAKIQEFKAKIIGMTVDELYTGWVALFAGTGIGFNKPTQDGASSDVQYWKFFSDYNSTSYFYLTVRDGKISSYDIIPGHSIQQPILIDPRGTNGAGNGLGSSSSRRSRG